MKEILFITNPWWEKKEFDSGIPRQKYLPKLIKSLNHKRAVLITGSRRVGKTTLLKQLIQYLITESRIKPKTILYVLLDHPRLAKISILEIVEEFRKMHLINRDEKIFLFFYDRCYFPCNRNGIRRVSLCYRCLRGDFNGCRVLLLR